MNELGPKRAIVRGSENDRFEACTVRAYPTDAVAFEAKTGPGVAVPKWKDWKFWTLDFTGLETGGEYKIECPNASGGAVVKSMPFRIQSEILEHGALLDLTYYFRSVRATGAIDKADSKIAFDRSEKKPIDARGGWYDASGGYGIHLSQLDFATYFNTQQVPLVAYSLGKAREILDARNEPNFAQIRRRLLDETVWYGRAWGSVAVTNNGLYQPASEARERVGGSFQGIQTRLVNKDGFVRYWDNISKAPYLYNAAKRVFVSYEDEQSVGLKAQYVKEHGLGGMMFWEYSGDPEIKLLDALNAGLR